MHNFDALSLEKTTLSTRLIRALGRNGILTMGDLKRSAATIHNFYQIGTKGIKEIQIFLTDAQKQEQSELLHQQLTFSSISDNQGTSDKKSEIKVQSWAKIIEPFFAKLDDRKKFIFVSRFGYDIKTLEEIAFIVKVTRERVRQIQDSIARKFINYVDMPDFQPTLSEIKEILFSQGEDFSLQVFEKKLQKKGILEIASNPIECSFKENINLLEIVMCWLSIMADSRYVSDDVLLDVDSNALKNARILSVKNSKILNNIPSLQKRKIIRRVVYTGGIRFKDAKKILSESDEITLVVLGMLNLVKIKDGWYSLKVVDLEHKRIPLRLAGLKMLAVVEEIDFDTFYDGLLRHASRFYETIAPPDIVTYLLQLLGFTIREQKVTSKVVTPGILAKSETCFVDAVKKNGNVVSFYELAEEFSAQGLSLPAVAIVTTRYPIAEKLDNGMYKIRGYDVSWAEIEAAQRRQKKFSQDEEISYGLDGIIRVKITVTNYAFLSGVINAYKIKDLTGKWHVFYNNQSFGDAKMDEMYLWGLTWAFGKLNVQTGERIQLAFNTWNRQLVLDRV